MIYNLEEQKYPIFALLHFALFLNVFFLFDLTVIEAKNN